MSSELDSLKSMYDDLGKGVKRFSETHFTEGMGLDYMIEDILKGIKKKIKGITDVDKMQKEIPQQLSELSENLLEGQSMIQEIVDGLERLLGEARSFYKSWTDYKDRKFAGCSKEEWWGSGRTPKSLDKQTEAIIRKRYAALMKQLNNNI